MSFSLWAILRFTYKDSQIQVFLIILHNLKRSKQLITQKVSDSKVENSYVLRITRTLKLCPVVLNTVLLSNCGFLLKVCPTITMTYFNLIKLLHALTFKMALKAAKCHLQNMQVTVHKVSNADNWIIVTHTSHLCLKYKFSFYKESLRNSDHITGKNNEPAEGLKYLWIPSH